MMNITDRLIPCSLLKRDIRGTCYRYRPRTYSFGGGNQFRPYNSNYIPLQGKSVNCQLSFLVDQTSRFADSISRTHDPPPPESLCDFLGANKLGKKFLIDDKQQHVPVETLRGKILALYFAVPLSKALSKYGGMEVPDYYIDFYNTLKEMKPDAAFEMIYVAPRNCDPSLFNAVVSTLPWLAVPFDDLDWRYYIFNLYNWRSSHPLVLVDTKDNRIRVFKRNRDIVHHIIYAYGPLYYPFTSARLRQLEEHSKEIGRETSISAILGSDSCNHLMDPHYNKVPISALQNKDILIYGFIQKKNSEHWLVSQLQEIHSKFRNGDVEIVSVNLGYNGGNGDYETLWEDHLAQISWLHLPVRDEKTWLLRNMMVNGYSSEIRDDPILFVKPKGESLLDPYGYQVLEKFGFQAFPFTRKAAGLSLLTKLKALSIKSFVDEASHLGLDLNSLIRHKADGGTEFVSLSTILEGRARGILILFICLQGRSRDLLNSLINNYLNQHESSSFEVIFFSTGDGTQYFNDHFSFMPWFSFHRPLNWQEYKDLFKRTTHIDFNGTSGFLAFGPGQLLIRVGMLTKSFENCVFPFVNDAESTDHLAYSITKSSDWCVEADGTEFNEGDGWGRGIAYAVNYRQDDWFYEDGTEFSKMSIYKHEAAV